MIIPPTAYREGKIKINPNDKGSISQIERYNKTLPYLRKLSERRNLIVAGMVFPLYMFIDAIFSFRRSAAKMAYFWLTAMPIIEVVLLVLFIITIRKVTGKPGYPEFREIEICLDPKLPYHEPKMPMDDLDRYMAENELKPEIVEEPEVERKFFFDPYGDDEE